MSRIAPVILLLVVCTGEAAFAEPRKLTLDEAIRLALEANPDVKWQGEEIAAARARVAGASTLIKDNPSVTLNMGPRHDPSGWSFDYGAQVLQPIEIGGQRGARRAAATAQLAASRQELDAVKNAIAAVVREQFGKAIAAAERVKLADEALAIAAEGSRAADERLRAGATPTLELNLARVEMGRATRGRAQAMSALAVALAALRETLAIDPSTELILDGELPQPGAALNVDERAALIEEALTRRAEVARLRYDLDAALAETRVASRERIPTPRLGVSYARESGSETSIVQGVIAFDLPFFNRNVAARGVAAARVRQVRIAQAELERKIRQDVLVAVERVRIAEAAAQGYSAEVVNAMNDNMELVTEAYRAGKIDLLQLIVIRREAVAARRELIDLLEELGSARAALDLALGRVGGGR